MKMEPGTSLNDLIGKEGTLIASVAALKKGSTVVIEAIDTDGLCICRVKEGSWFGYPKAHTCSGFFEKDVGYYVTSNKISIKKKEITHEDFFELPGLEAFE